MGSSAGSSRGARAWSAATTQRFRWTAGVLILAFVAIAVVTVLEGDLPEAFGDGVRLIGRLLHQFGVVAAFALLYLEESGVPMPMPGDVFVMYVGHHSSTSVLGLVVAWLALVSVVVLGATNLFLISRRWGRSLVERRLARLLHLTPASLGRAERWFARWGVLTLVFGRHVPGLRVPLTVAAGIFGVRYRVFIVSVAVSTAIWAGAFLLIGAAVGGRVGHLLQLHREGYIVIPAVITLVFAGYLVVMIRRAGQLQRSE